MREQVAQQIPPRSTRYSAPNEPPSWMSQLEREPRNRSKVPPEGLGPVKPREEIKQYRVPELPTAGLPMASQQENRSEAAARELHVKVWEPESTIVPSLPEEQSMPVEEEAVDDLPTRPLIASSPEMLNQRNSIAASPHKIQQSHLKGVEDLDTVPLSAYIDPTAQARDIPMQQIRRPSQEPHHSIEPPAHQMAYPPIFSRTAMQVHTGPATSNVSPPYPPQALRPSPYARHTPPPQMSVSAPKRRKPLTIVLLTLLVLIVGGGLGAWIVIRQPFSVPSITQPQQSFKDSQLGVSLLYPSSWTSQIDRHKATVYLYDSSHTDQVNIVVGISSGDLNQALQQQASQLGMTGQKPGTPLSFAGTTWQQLQGNVQQKGASYTETLLVTVHNQHLYTIMLLAPQTTYAQEEQYVFSAMRSSFQFVL